MLGETTAYTAQSKLAGMKIACSCNPQCTQLAQEFAEDAAVVASKEVAGKVAVMAGLGGLLVGAFVGYLIAK